MAAHLTEEEQLEAIKAWWKKNYTWLLGLLTLIFLTLAAYQYWNWRQSTQRLQASNHYEKLMLALAHNDEKSIRAYAQKLIATDKTVYAQVATLLMANYYSQQAKFAEVEVQLKKVITETKIPELRDLAKLRLARCYIYLKQYDKVSPLLDALAATSYAPMVMEVLGDLAVAKGQLPQGLDFYKQAEQAFASRQLNNNFLELKKAALEAKL